MLLCQGLSSTCRITLAGVFLGGEPHKESTVTRCSPATADCERHVAHFSDDSYFCYSLEGNSMIIPHTELSPDVLRGVIEEFVLREGTEYGEREVSLEIKVSQVIRQLERGEVSVLFDPESESCDIVTKGSARYKAATVENVEEAHESLHQEQKI